MTVLFFIHCEGNGISAHEVCISSPKVHMTFTALTGSLSHFAIDGLPDMATLVFCILSTLLWARIAAKIANKADAKTLNRVVGVVLVVLGGAVLIVNCL